MCSLYVYSVSEMTYTVSSGTLNPSIPYHTSISTLHTSLSSDLQRPKCGENNTQWASFMGEITLTHTHRDVASWNALQWSTDTWWTSKSAVRLIDANTNAETYTGHCLCNAGEQVTSHGVKEQLVFQKSIQQQRYTTVGADVHQQVYKWSATVDKRRSATLSTHEWMTTHWQTAVIICNSLPKVLTIPKCWQHISSANQTTKLPVKKTKKTKSSNNI